MNHGSEKKVATFHERQHERQIESAKAELTEAEAVRVLLSNNTLAAEIHISGMVFGVCDNKWLLPIIDKQVDEIQKFIDGKENLWE